MAGKFFFWLHKWLGLVTGLVVFVISITGCINVFSDDLKEIFYRDRFYYTPVKNAAPMNFSAVRDKVQDALGPKYKISRCEIYPEPGRAWIFRASATEPEAIGYWNAYKYYYRVYINPYNGDVLKVEDTKNEFFQVVLNLHMNLLLGEYIGGWVTGISTLCFFLILISGLVLWWPNKWKAKILKNKLTVKRGTSGKRFNYDLHNATGFYVLIPALLICITGLVFAFTWADDTVQYLANGAKTIEKRVIPKSSPNEDYATPATDSVITQLLKTHTAADFFSIRIGSKKTDPLNVQVRLAEKRTHLFNWYYFDRNTGATLLKYGDDNIQGGEKFKSMNYDLHTGAYAGLFTKAIYFLISLFCASLPVTGFLIWYNRGSGKKKGKRKVGRLTLHSKQ